MMLALFNIFNIVSYGLYLVIVFGFYVVQVYGPILGQHRPTKARHTLGSS